MARKPETKLREKIRDAIKVEYGTTVHVFHPHGSQFGRNALDLVGCLAGRYFELEVKMPRGRATDAQQEIIERVRKAGGIAAVVHSVEEALDALED